MMANRSKKSALHTCLLVLLTFFSARLAFDGELIASPYSALALISFACIFLPVGWWAACAIAGFYVAFFCFIAAIRSGPAEVQAWEDVTYIATNVTAGFIVGLFFDSWHRTHPQSPEP